MTLEKFRPLLAASIEDGDPSTLVFPMIGSPKIDGIRIFCHPELGPVTRSLKPVGNEYVRKFLSSPDYMGFDGEITVGPNCGPNVFANTTGAIRGSSGQPNFTYWVFDLLKYEIPYQERWQHLAEAVGAPVEEDRVCLLEYCILHNYEDLLVYEAQCLERGFEGIMVRNPMGRYKFGRSTFKEQILIKVKRFKDDEATIIGFAPLERNNNVQVRNLLGLAERSSHKAGRVADNLLGTLMVDHPSFGTFGIGSGFDVTTRQEIWEKRDAYLGRRVTFKYQPIGTVDKPRFPIFMRFRPDE